MNWWGSLKETALLKTTRNRGDITLTRLVNVFREIGKQSMISRSERSSSWDFDRSLEFVREQGLQDHIYFVSHRDRALPLHSERHIYDLNNIVVRDLEIELGDTSAWNVVDDWKPVCKAKLHFEGCRFWSPSHNMSSVTFPWRGSFRFRHNEFCFPSSQHGGTWIFSFINGTRVWLVGNDFLNNGIQTRCVSTESDEDDSDSTFVAEGWRGQGHISFVANKAVNDLWIQEGYSSIEITGMNRIDRLMVDLTISADGDERTSIYLGPREKIDPSFHNCFQHRSLFLTMRQLASMNHDGRQLTVLDRQLERIEYFLNKEQDSPSPLEYPAWIEYWQDRTRYAWRRWSSDFYGSWLRPLAMLVIGYLLINAFPALFIESFSISHWIDFTLRPVTEIATYETSLSRIMGDEYKTVPASTKSFLKLANIIEVIWIGVWGFALAKSIKR